MKHYQAIVLGTGGIGSATLAELARRGIPALGVDRFRPPHDRGSSHGHTRIIRQAYFEHPDYVPLLLESYRRWAELEAATGAALYGEVGLVQIGSPQGEVVRGVLRTAEQYQLPLQAFSPVELAARCPGLEIPADSCCLWESRAGYLLVERCVEAQLIVAENHGAELLAPAEVLDWNAGPPICVRTSQGEFTCDKLVVTAGAWAAQLLKDLDVPLRVLRKSMFWYPSASSRYDAVGGCPCFLYELPQGIFYGVPRIDGRGVKVAEHSGGEPVSDPTQLDRQPYEEERRRTVEFIAAHLPDLSTEPCDHAACMYTMSPDEHFLVDRNPECADVVFAAGLSGHGFKFAPVLGAALADLALEGGSSLPIEFLSLDRFRR